MADAFQNYTAALDGPSAYAFAIAGNDSTDFSISTRGIYVGGAGDVKVTTIGGSTVTFSAVPQGTVLPIRVSRVFATGTTATLMIGLY